MFSFSPKKAIQASAVLLKEHGKRMSRLRLLKMLYMGDRELLKAVGVPITRDTVYAMENGPVLERVYDLIKGKDSELPLWSKYIKNVGTQDLILIKEPGVGCLSEFEVDTLKQIATRFRDVDDWKVADFTHRMPEWEKNAPPDGSRKLIPLHDVLDALGISDMEQAIEAEAKMEAIVEDALVRTGQ